MPPPLAACPFLGAGPSGAKTARNTGNFPLRLARLGGRRGMGGEDSCHAAKFGTIRHDSKHGGRLTDGGRMVARSRSADGLAAGRRGRGHREGRRAAERSRGYKLPPRRRWAAQGPA